MDLTDDEFGALLAELCARLPQAVLCDTPELVEAYGAPALGAIVWIEPRGQASLH